MLSVVKRIMNLSGEYRVRLIKANVISFFESLFGRVPIIMILYILLEIINNTFDSNDIQIAAVGLVIGVVLRTVFRYLVDTNQAGVGYEIFADKRMIIGDRIKRFPMGYFSDGNIGNLSAVITNDISYIEEMGMDAISKIVSSILGLIISLVFIALIDYRVAAVMALVTAICLIFLSKLQLIAKSESAKQHEMQKDLTDTIIEFIKGIPVVKAFNLVGKKHQATSADFQKFHDIQLNTELKVIKPATIILSVTGVGIAAIILLCSYLVLVGKMELPLMIMMIIFSFQIFSPVTALLATTPQIRMMESGLDRYEKVTRTKIIDADCHDLKLKKYDIEFENVSFAYDQAEVLQDVSFTVREKTLTALVGKSGSGKTTIVNLIARFWDTTSGSVKIGGIEIKGLRCDSLLKYISMVFQEVYLFNDTIYNNILIGKPDATKDQVIEACQKARCYSFIMKLKDGFETIVGEGGATLSGGEKQRISIARAILKDAPIVLLDEATASIDPDNEAYIQKAISELVNNKTLIVIAHKLYTIEHADQIIVLDKGRIVEKGRHNELIANKSEYYKLWNKRVKAKSWKIKK